MNSFEYLFPLISIIAGLGLTRAISGIAEVVHTNERKLSAVHIAWTTGIILWLIIFWWFTYLLNSIETWAIELLFFILLYSSVIYFLIALLYPDDFPSQVDHFEYFLKKRRWFFGAFLTLAFLDLVDTYLKYKLQLVGPSLIPYSLLMISWISIGIFGFVSASHLLHRIIAFSWVIIMVAWSATIFSL